MDFEKHPCFSTNARHTTGRIHLPVAPKCNIQCNFCNRKFDCVNESRPGVTSSILTPVQALTYLDSVLERIDNLSVVGIAGPGDPFATPEDTVRTLELVHEKYPEKILCLATNGLGLPEYVNRLSRVNLSHVTVTVNAVNPSVGAKIYSWVRFGPHVYRGEEAASLLLKRQTEGIRLLKQYGINVKINTVVIPGVNDDHVEEIARYCRELGADVQNCMPLMHVEDTAFEDVPSPTGEQMTGIRLKAGAHLRQLSHCARCRADAVGMIGQANGEEIAELLKQATVLKTTASRPNVAVATMEGLFVNRHLGDAPSLWVYGRREGRTVLLEQRPTPVPGTAEVRWTSLADRFTDCAAVFVSGCGGPPQKILEASGLHVVAVEGLIDEVVESVFDGREIPKMLVKRAGHCGAGAGCSGTGGGCG